MPRLLFLIGLSLLGTSAAAHAAQNWEICLDKVDFNFTLDDFRGSKTVSKSGCTMQILAYGGKGEKFEVNLCDPLIHVKRFPGIEDKNGEKLPAGTAGCPAPLFGADFDENALQLQEYRSARDRIFEIFALIKSTYGPDADRVDLNNPKSLSETVSSGRVACGQYLLREYLQRCMAFEAKPIAETKGGITDPKSTAPSNIPGVHPQTIVAPKK